MTNGTFKFGTAGPIDEWVLLRQATQILTNRSSEQTRTTWGRIVVKEGSPKKPTGWKSVIVE